LGRGRFESAQLNAAVESKYNEGDQEKQRLSRTMLLMIDNYDSFTYNLVQYFGELGEDVRVERNDQISVDEVEKLAPERICISPGPCTPNEAGITLDLIARLGERVPILGVCLGHQALGQAYGGTVVRAKQLMHGKTSRIEHNGAGVFHGLPRALVATRYHSLAVRRDDLPACLEITAWTPDGEIMGLRHRSFPVQGVQFHPESIATEYGHEMLRNFLTRQ
jgi:anthranilate synthase component II